MTDDGATAARLARSLAIRVVLLSILWWALTEGRSVSVVGSVVAVLAATAASIVMRTPGERGVGLPGLLNFLPYFLRESLRGGADVARRALDPRMPILPGFIDHDLRLPPGTARTFFLLTLGLLPGSLSARIEGDVVRVHLLDRRLPARRLVEEYELRVAALFGIRF